MAEYRKHERVNKVAKKLTLLPETIEYISDYARENKCSGFSDAVDRLARESSEREGNEIVSEVIASMTTDKVVEALKRTYLDPLRIRTGYADKQTKALLEVLNHLIVKNGWDAENVITTDIRKSNVLETSEKKIAKQIEHFKQNKTTREAKRK